MNCFTKNEFNEMMQRMKTYIETHNKLIKQRAELVQQITEDEMLNPTLRFSGYAEYERWQWVNQILEEYSNAEQLFNEALNMYLQEIERVIADFELDQDSGQIPML